MKYGDRVRYNDNAHAEHKGRKGLHRGIGTVVQPPFTTAQRPVPTRLVQWDDSRMKDSIVSEDDLEVIEWHSRRKAI